MSSRGRHVVGAVAGLAPATAIIGYYLGTGGPVLPGLLLFIVAPVVAGWLIGPRLDGTTHADVRGAIAFLILAHLLHAGLGVVLRGLQNGQDLVGYLTSLLEALGTGAVVAALYLPFWAVVLSPLALLWVVTARILRAGLRVSHAGGRKSREVPPRRPLPILLWPPIAALIGYTLGFMLTAPSQCIATSTVGAEASVKESSTSVCTSMIGVTYSGQGAFDPPRDLAIAVGLVFAAVAFVVVVLMLLWNRRADRIEPLANGSR